MGWYLMCRESNGDLNYAVKIGSKDHGERIIEDIERKQTYALTHTIEERKTKDG